MDQPKAPRATPEAMDLLFLRLRETLTRNEKAAPALCIQGGGAKGAWEAGALARLLTTGPNTFPSSIWGTSAGALNALWSRDPEILNQPTRLIDYWTMLARRLMSVALGFAVGIIGFVILLFSLPLFWMAAFFILAVLLIVFLYALARWRKIARLPGLIPSTFARLIVPRPRSIAPGFVVYTCVSNVDSPRRPEFCSAGRGWFMLASGSSSFSAEHMASGEPVDAFHIAVASASLPIIVRPTSLAGMTLLDGGLVANLPAGFIRSNGALGGAYVLCIVPRSVSELSTSDPIDYRTLRFLCDLRDEQAQHRSAAAGASSWSGPAYTHVPIFVLSPLRHLKSGLIGFWPPWLRREFWQGYKEAKIFSDSLIAFRQGDIRPMSEFLLEQVLQRSDAPVEPSKRFWYMWANTRW